MEVLKLLWQFVSAIYFLLFAKLGWVLFADLHVWNMSMKENAEFMEGGLKWRYYFYGIYRPKFMKFWDSVGALCNLKHCSQIVYNNMFCSKNICC